MAITTQLIGRLGGGLSWENSAGNTFFPSAPTVLKVISKRGGTWLSLRIGGSATTQRVDGTTYYLVRVGDFVSGLGEAQTVEYLKLD